MNATMVQMRNDFEAKNGKEYLNWPPRSAAGGKGAGKGEKGEKPAKPLQKDTEGNVLPVSRVGCDYLAQGKECPRGENCKFSHDDPDVAARKKFLKQTARKDTASPKAKAKATPRKKPGPAAEAIVSTLEELEDDEEDEEEDEDSDSQSDES